MKLRSISLSYFRQHVSARVVFADGLIGIIGGNGSGKTTIVEAVGFALFGSRALRGRVEDVRSRGAPQRSKRGNSATMTSVELVVEHESMVFRIVRTLSSAELYVGGEAKPMVQGTREVSSKVSSIVGMSFDEFVATYCTEQKGLEFLSGQKGATEREKFVMRMMGYDRLQELQTLIRADRKEKRAVLQGHEAGVGVREDLVIGLQEEEAKLKTTIAKHEEAKQTLAKAESDFAARHEQMRRLEGARELFLQEREHVRTLEVRIEERAKRASLLNESEIQEQNELEQLSKPLIKDASLAACITTAQDEVAEATRLVEDLRGLVRSAELQWRESVSSFRARRDALIDQRDQLVVKAKRVGELDVDGVCPTCQQPLGDSVRSVEQHLDEEMDILTNRIDQLDADLREVQKVPQKLSDAQEKLKVQVQLFELGERKLGQLQQCQIREQRVQALRKEQDELKRELQFAREHLEKAHERLKTVEFREEEYTKQKVAHDAAQRLVEVARLQRVRFEGEVNTQTALVDRSTADIEKFDQREAAVASVRHELRVIDECDLIVTDFRKWINTTVRPRMAELASEYLSDLTDGRYTAVELADDFTPTVIEDGEAKRVISGGEEDILNLCMRIALSHMLAERAGQRFSLLMLDEVFGSLDENRRSNVLSLLEKLRQRFEQIIIITHLDDIKDGVQHLVQVEYDEGRGCANVLTDEYLVEEDMSVNF